MNFLFQVVFRKISDVKRERELAETRKNEGLDQISSDHPVRKLISKFRKISQESRSSSQTAPLLPSSSSLGTVIVNQQQMQPISIPDTLVEPPSAEPIEESAPTDETTSTALTQLLQIPPSSTTKSRDKLETISERIETQESQVSQITSVNQSPPLQQPLRSTKWKWLKNGANDKKTSATSKPTTNPPTEAQNRNPFDPNLSDDDCTNKESDSSNRKQSIPLSLFIPREAQVETSKLEDSIADEHVCLTRLFLIQNEAYSISSFCFIETIGRISF